MPRLPKNPEWIGHVFGSFTPGQLQSGYRLLVPTKVRTPRARWPFKVVEAEKSVAGTGIPASTLARFASGEWTPRERSLSKLYAFWRRSMYNELRSRGANPQEAALHSGRSAPAALRALSEYARIAREIAESKDVPEEYVRLGMTLSDRRLFDWITYEREKRLAPPPKRSRRKRHK